VARFVAIAFFKRCSGFKRKASPLTCNGGVFKSNRQRRWRDDILGATKFCKFLLNGDDGNARYARRDSPRGFRYFLREPA
jgi:hypothetical protein